MRIRLAPCAALTVVALALSGGTAGAAVLYAPGYYAPDDVSGYARAADGSLTPIAGSPFFLPADPSGIIALGFTPDGGRA
ncbi:MAG TPA: hypothetical protein VF072_14550, partial [Thermoleophilaceae bacterium]